MFHMTFKELSLNSSLANVQDSLISLVYRIKNYSNLSVITMSGKLLVVTAAFAVFPLTPIVPNEPKAYQTNLKWDANNPLSIVSNKNKVALEIGDSEFDKQEKAKTVAQAKVQAVAKKTVAKASVHNDPSDFRIVYMAAAKQFGIPWQLIEAVHQVESGKSGSTTTRSGAGAQGPMQFMPGTWRAYGVDGNGDGVADATDVVDAIYGAAHYLARSGADEGRIDDALFNYNHAQWYVTKVKTIAYEIGM
ncbi:MAG: lytic transglycosylase [Berkelbacteria bacterium GW2011_GWE1_39_12]|uniref:Lytic transglycosylase n=1 Tax=Berkelbacteria bacterium GW2011_GWE1_39_12 TaxID=1618337 RepID=A0A0G4B5Y1_9BACT|nr:MAG: lytic transglycosylase [Berkelbacteria bacterium GW2011_GWE1_39_12]